MITRSGSTTQLQHNFRGCLTKKKLTGNRDRSSTGLKKGIETLDFFIVMLLIEDARTSCAEFRIMRTSGWKEKPCTKL